MLTAAETAFGIANWKPVTANAVRAFNLHGVKIQGVRPMNEAGKLGSPSDIKECLAHLESACALFKMRAGDPPQVRELTEHVDLQAFSGQTHDVFNFLEQNISKLGQVAREVQFININCMIKYQLIEGLRGPGREFVASMFHLQNICNVPKSVAFCSDLYSSTEDPALFDAALRGILLVKYPPSDIGGICGTWRNTPYVKKHGEYAFYAHLLPIFDGSAAAADPAKNAIEKIFRAERKALLACEDAEAAKERLMEIFFCAPDADWRVSLNALDRAFSVKKGGLGALKTALGDLSGEGILTTDAAGLYHVIT